MIVIMRPDTTREEIDKLKTRIEDGGLQSE